MLAFQMLGYNKWMCGSVRNCCVAGKTESNQSGCHAGDNEIAEAFTCVRAGPRLGTETLDFLLLRLPLSDNRLIRIARQCRGKFRTATSFAGCVHPAAA